MIWCRFQAGSTVSYGIVENDVITQVEGDPFAGHKLTSTKHPVNKVKLLVPFVPGTFISNPGATAGPPSGGTTTDYFKGIVYGVPYGSTRL